MAAAETARLIAELSLKDKLTPGVKTATASLGKLDTSLGRIGQSAKRGAKVAGAALAGLGAAAAVGIGAGIRNGIDSLTELESAVTSVDGAIQQAGLTGKITGAQIATMANEIETTTQAAFDDKEITAGAGALIRYGKVTQSNLRPALEVMTDLAAKTGSVDSAATLLAKALADPAKAAGKLARQGVVLTKAEQDQIKALMKAGKLGEAQTVVLTALERTTKGAAAAINGPYKDAQQTLADVGEDATRALAEGFLPVLQRVAKWLSTSLADPRVMSDIRNLGQTLAGAFDDAVSFVQKVPWGSVKDGMAAVAGMAKMALDAFTAMPSWVQAAVVGGWGLNKITGGALGDIVGELGKGLIKGVLGIQAGVVNVTGGVVNGPGGIGAPTPAVPGTTGGGGGITGLLKNAIKLIPVIAIPLAGKDTLGTKSPAAQKEFTEAAIRRGIDPTGDRIVDAVGALKSDTRSEGVAQRQALQAIKAKTGESITAFRAAERASANQKPPTVTVSTNVKVNVTTNSITKSATIQKRVGGGTGSRDANFKGGKQIA